MALRVASLGCMPCSRWCMTASTTTIASSTTMPIASTRPSSESTLIEKPSSGKKMKAPISETGTVTSGISVARQFWRNTKTTRMTSATASNSVWTISLMPSATGSVVSSEIRYSMSRGKRWLRSSIVFLMRLGHLQRVRPGDLEDGDDGGRAAVVAADRVVQHRAELEARHVLEEHLRAVGVAADDDVAELLLVEQAPLRLDGVGVLGPRHRGRPADLAGRGDLVLLVDGVHDVRDRDPELRDAVGPEPDAHGVVAAAEEVDLADARDAGDRVVDVDRGVVREEVVVVRPLRRLDRLTHSIRVKTMRRAGSRVRARRAAMSMVRFFVQARGRKSRPS